MTHATPWRRGRTGNESGNRLLAIFLGPTRGFNLGIAANFADQNDGFGFRVFVEHLKHIEMRGAIDRITSNAHAGALAITELRQLPHSFIGQRAGTRNHTDIAALVNVSRRNANAATAMAFLTATRRHQSRAVWPDEARLGSGKHRLDPHHVHHGNPLGDAHDQIHTSVRRFKNCIGRKGWRHENRRCRGTGFLHRFGHSVEDRHGVFKFLPALARRDAAHNLGAVFE